jgi:dTDP-4-amino-4,6-dideoxygalactose transaminase
VVKRVASDLALLGGPPAFERLLHVGEPNVAGEARFLELAAELLRRRRLTNRGPLVREFERRIAEQAGVRHCVAMCNATVALEIAIRAAGLSGEVILPSWTFVATAHALQWQEITPVFCDVDPHTFTLDPARVEALITPRTSGILGVHLWGRPCDVEGLAAIARRRGLRLLFDAAHAFGCSRHGAMVGGFGDAEVFSFHATKFLNTFEGGAVVTNDDGLAEKVRLMQNFGFAGRDRVVYIGTNGKMSEICAAMGLTSLEHMDAFIAANRANWRAYRAGLDGVAGLSLIEYDERERSNFHYVALQVDEQRAGIDRDRLVDVLHAENVIARRYFFPGAHRMEPYRSYQPHASLLLPVTERIARRSLLLPTGTAVSTAEVERICHLVRTAVACASALACVPALDVLAQSQPVEA